MNVDNLTSSSANRKSRTQQIVGRALILRVYDMQCE
eukprot:CAMPEP_0179438742 /NCGR_PEP_ID=MMETSP0799-20121207/22439_1 /TAXON_ID=46947 /ORGANISM="Geminigera cryophila, Strain CCMP2564" /LENGTH=35 /DNA_ID= /DNA_START= /DNA_END= /DNA_ORIENTATION=